MKIALFWNLDAGGGKRTLYEEVKYLSKKHIIDIYTYDSVDDLVFLVNEMGKRVYLSSFNLRSGNRLIKDFKNFFVLPYVNYSMARRINNGGYDVALIHADKYTQAPFLIRFLKIPTLYFCQEYLRIVHEKHLRFNEPVIFWKRWYENGTRLIRKYIDKSNLLAADLVLVNSKFTKRNIRKAYGVDSIVCYLGVDTKVFKQVVGRIKNQVVFLGGKNLLKGYPLAKRICKEAQVKLVSFSFLKGEDGISNDERLAQVYSESLATLCVSEKEPFGLTAIESMACQTPVISVNDGGFTETVIDGKTGYLLSREVDEFVSKLKKIKKDRVLRRRMGLIGRKWVKKNFSWEIHNTILERQLYNLCKLDGKKN